MFEVVDRREVGERVVAEPERAELREARELGDVGEVAAAEGEVAEVAGAVDATEAVDPPGDRELAQARHAGDRAEGGDAVGAVEGEGPQLRQGRDAPERGARAGVEVERAERGQT